MLTLAGVSFRTSPVALRERVALPEHALAATTAALRARPGVREALVLSTCNRTELYVVADDAPDAAALAAWLADRCGVPADALHPALYLRHDADAVRHLLRVASGLDSMVVGEAQILGQVRRAYDAARAGGGPGVVLHRLLQTAITTGRRVRRETGLALRSPSVPRAALALAERLIGPVRGRRVAIVGAGAIAGIAADAFGAAGAVITAVLNRTAGPAEALAARVGAVALPLDHVGEAAAEATVLLACVGPSRPVVTRARLAPALRGMPLLIIDLGVPRGVEPAVAGLPGVTLRGLDDLSGEELQPGLSGEGRERARALIEAAAARFDRWLAAREASPVIAALCDRAEAIVDLELRRNRRRLGELDEAQQRAVRAAVDAVVRKLLHHPLVSLRESAARRDGRVLEVARALFDLPSGNGKPGATA
ncbi:MAG: glutamyl-tRNA reductase [Armatimonadota bacterium]|nr:glutamyl-tRNA reductase [Armatimonadota bacterium]